MSEVFDIDQYTIKDKIGEGGMAEVYLAYDNQMKSYVAIKQLKQEYVHSPNIKGRFIAEARSMFSMNHVNVVKVFNLIEKDDFIGAVMEYVPGVTLNEFIRNRGVLKNESIKKLLAQMTDALDYVHGVGMIHRDVKPSNFIVNDNLEVKLLDFGIAKNQNSEFSDYTATSTSQQMGTPLYMSPEQIKSPNKITHLTDIYSLGVVLYYMVTGKSPYNEASTSLFELQMKIVQEKLPATKTCWDGVIQKATMKEPGDRYPSAREFWMNVKNIDFNATIVDIPPRVETKVVPSRGRVPDDNIQKKKKQKKRLLIFGIAALVLILGTAIGISMIETAEEKIAAAKSVVTMFSKDLDLDSRNERLYPGIKNMGDLYYLREFKITSSELNENGTITVFGSYSRMGNKQNVKFTVAKQNGKYRIKESRGVSGYYDSPLMTYCLNKGYLDNFNDITDKQLDKICQKRQFEFNYLVDRVVSSIPDKVHMENSSSDVRSQYGLYASGHVTIINESNVDLPIGSVRYIFKMVDRNYNEVFSKNLTIYTYLPAGSQIRESVFISDLPRGGDKYLVAVEVIDKSHFENAVAKNPYLFE